MGLALLNYLGIVIMNSFYGMFLYFSEIWRIFNLNWVKNFTLSSTLKCVSHIFLWTYLFQKWCLLYWTFGGRPCPNIAAPFGNGYYKPEKSLHLSGEMRQLTLSEILEECHSQSQGIGCETYRGGKKNISDLHAMAVSDKKDMSDFSGHIFIATESITVWIGHIFLSHS